MTDCMVHAHGSGVKAGTIESAEAIERADGREIVVRRFSSTNARDAGREVRVTWQRLCEILRDPPRADRKDRLPLLKLAEFGDRRNARGSFRHDANVDTVYGVEGDHDAGTVSPAEAAARLARYGLRAIVYTTPSHRPDAPRWRVLAPLARPCSVAERAARVALLNGALDGVLAPESWTASQPFYFGRIEGGDYETHVLDGLCIDDLDAILTPIGKTKAAPAEVVPIAPSAERAEVEALLAQLDPSCGYQDWYYAGMAAQSALGDEGLGVWDAWSAGSHKYPGREVLEAKWRSFHADGAVTIEWLRAQVRNRPASPDEFDIVAEPPTARLRFASYSASELLNRPRPPALVKGLVPRDALGLAFGEPGTGKSFLMLDLGAAVARGLAEWRGHRITRGRVYFVVAEGAAHFPWRVAAYEREHGLEPGASGVRLITDRPHFLRDDARALAAQVKAEGGADLVFVDTLSQTMLGGDENSPEDMGRALRSLQLVRELTGATVVAVHHPGKDTSRGARGWSGVLGALDFEFAIERLGDRERALRVTKMKDGADGGVYPFQLRPVTLGRDEDGDPITSQVVEHLATVTSAPKRRALGKVEAIVLRVVQDLEGVSGEGVPVDEVLTATAAQLTVDPQAKHDKRRQNAKRSLDALIAEGHLQLAANSVRLTTHAVLTSTT